MVPAKATASRSRRPNICVTAADDKLVQKARNLLGNDATRTIEVSGP